MPEGSATPTFDEFFAAESEDLFRRLWLVTRNRHEAEEVMQDAFLSLFERWDRMDEGRRPEGVPVSDGVQRVEAAIAQGIPSASVRHIPGLAPR